MFGSNIAGRLGNTANIRKNAEELAALAPDVILALAPRVVAPLLQATRTMPIVFVNVVDPVGAGLIDSSVAAGRQRYRLYSVRIRFEREMAGTAQGDLRRA